MEFNKTIAARQSVRKFTEARITDEQLKAILEAANAAPACMGQYDHLHLTVVQKPEILAQINAAFQKAVGDPNMQVTYGAPTVIYVSCKNEDEEIVKGCNAGSGPCGSLYCLCHESGCICYWRRCIKGR